MKCLLGHSWMGWSSPFAKGGTILQQRNCRKCNKIIVREVFARPDARSLFKQIFGSDA